MLKTQAMSCTRYLTSLFMFSNTLMSHKFYADIVIFDNQH